MAQKFNKVWFKRHQKILLRIVNTKPGKRFFCLQGTSLPEGQKIIKISPNSITWKAKKSYITEFRTNEKFARRIYYGLMPIWKLLHFWDMNIANRFFPQLNLGFDTTGNLFSTTADGFVYHFGATYSTVQSAATGTTVDTTGNTSTGIRNESSAGGQFDITRSFYYVDTSSIPVSAIINSAIFSLVSNGVKNTTIDDTVQVVASTAADTLTTADYDAFTVGNYVDSPPAYSTFPTDTYKDMTLNSNGRAGITKTGTTKLCIRATGDINASAPGAGVRSFMQLYYADNTGTTFDPKLVVTYSLSGGAFLLNFV